MAPRKPSGGDHPRVCGEHITNQATCGSGQGSSPRMRGAHHQPGDVRQRPGIIPAYAGSTTRALRTPRGRWDHPRVCGEHRRPRVCMGCKTGSSPRMRGAPHGHRLGVRGAGIIPAYAGSTSRRARRSRRGEDHPRVCGEHSTACATVAPLWGSSPRMRGALFLQLLPAVVVGIIPAYAGSTKGCPGTRWRRWDHPRVCGEHVSATKASVSALGSSPRMRGARRNQDRALEFSEQVQHL